MSIINSPDSKGHACRTKGVKTWSTYSSWEVRNGWDKDVAARHFKPIKGDYILIRSRSILWS